MADTQSWPADLLPRYARPAEELTELITQYGDACYDSGHTHDLKLSCRAGEAAWLYLTEIRTRLRP